MQDSALQQGDHESLWFLSHCSSAGDQVLGAGWGQMPGLRESGTRAGLAPRPASNREGRKDPGGPDFDTGCRGRSP